MSIIIFFLVLLVLVMIHESGHFFAAKISKMRVEEFAFGFPPKLFGKKVGETLYAFNLLPIGGYVKITGESFDEGERKNIASDKKAFQNRPKYLQIFVLSAGVIMNLVLAVVLFSFIYTQPHLVSSSDTDYGSRVTDAHIVVVGVSPNSPVEAVGMIPGDKILNMFTGKSVAKLDSSDSVVNFVKDHNEEPITIVYERTNTGKVSTTTLQAVYGLVDGRKSLGFAVDHAGMVSLPVGEAIVKATTDTGKFTWLTMTGLVDIIKKVANGENVMNALAGPVGIAKMVGGASEAGAITLLTFVAILSINLAVFNALPIPALDGGRIVFVLIEMIIRRPLNYKFQYWANSISFLFLIGLILTTTFFDIFR
jgi:regulator of sigma E protease